VSAPTAFPDLNGVLHQLVTGAAAALGVNFCGAYLQGSFALGEADVNSDVDFIVATHCELTEREQAALQGLHARLHELDASWAQHLEGSYVPKDRLRRVDPSRETYFYLDNGARSLVWADHCNTALVRWVLREHGVVLAGPEAKLLVDPVSAELLRAEALSALHEYAVWTEESRVRYEVGEGLETWSELPFSRWQQPYVVLSFCRMLWTLQKGKVTTKRRAAEWAAQELDPEWTDLIEQALGDRPNPWDRTRRRSEPELVERTCAFVEYALGYAESRRR
jgi:predicted nucleotidyltransferase